MSADISYGPSTKDEQQACEEMRVVLDPSITVPPLSPEQARDVQVSLLATFILGMRYQAAKEKEKQP